MLEHNHLLCPILPDVPTDAGLWDLPLDAVSRLCAGRPALPDQDTPLTPAARAAAWAALVHNPAGDHTHD